MQEPLEGIKVLEMTVAVQGPSAGLYLRDMGAEVVKLNHPVTAVAMLEHNKQYP